MVAPGALRWLGVGVSFSFLSDGESALMKQDQRTWRIARRAEARERSPNLSGPGSQSQPITAVIVMLVIFLVMLVIFFIYERKSDHPPGAKSNQGLAPRYVSTHQAPTPSPLHGGEDGNRGATETPAPLPQR